MIQEQPAVQVVPEVDPELQSLLGDGEELTGLAHLLVLLGAPDLGGVHFREDLLLRDSQNFVHRWNDPLALNGGGPALDGAAARIVQQVNSALVPVDREWIVGDVPIVKAVSAQSLSLRPPRQVSKVLLQPVSQRGVAGGVGSQGGGSPMGRSTRIRQTPSGSRRHTTRYRPVRVTGAVSPSWKVTLLVPVS